MRIFINAESHFDFPAERMLEVRGPSVYFRNWGKWWLFR